MVLLLTLLLQNFRFTSFPFLSLCVGLLSPSDSLFFIQSNPECSLADLEKPGMDEEPTHVRLK